MSVKDPKNHPIIKPAAGALSALAAAGLAAFAWGSCVERRLYTLREQTLDILPEGAEALRILHLSDLHLAPWQRDKQQWVRALAELKPDLIVNTGDNIGHPDAYEALEYTLEPFRGIPGVYVYGSNDYFGPEFKNPLRYFVQGSHKKPAKTLLDLPRMTTHFDSLGWSNLNNAATAFPIKGNWLEFFGVDDPHRRFDKLEIIAGALDEVRENTPDTEGKDPLVIGVTHAPYQRVLNSFVTHGAELIFAGHTHGGQVCLPGFGALVTNCDIPRRQVAGLSSWKHGLRSAQLQISAGLGTSIYAPFRFACKPEATLLTLRSPHREAE